MAVAESPAQGSQERAGLDLAPEKEDKIWVASNAQLMWWKFLRHKLAVVSLGVIVAFYLVAALCEFVAPYDPQAKFAKYKFSPPSRIRLVDANGNWHLPFINQTTRELDMVTARSIYIVDESVLYPVQFFVRSNEYKLLGLFPTDRHLFGLTVPQRE